MAETNTDEIPVIKRLSDEEKSRPLPSDAPAMLAELKRQSLPPKALEDLRAFARFYLWATPLFELGYVKIGKRFVEFTPLIAKRFMIGLGKDNVPRMEVQASEMQWMLRMPWSYAGIHYKTGRICLLCRPEKPLSASYFIIPVDILEKLNPFQGKRYINITEPHLFNTPYMGPKVTLELKELDDGFFTKRKVKNKL